ncbi:MAG: SRPBCC family protein [Actinobacteria bacterium]|nr:SRPBCC family protein [Actinomycetota bacterium]
MRYADGPTVEVEVLVAAPIERVWALVSDIDLPARFSGELLEARWVDDVKLGARFTGRNHHDALGEWETTAFVVRYEPPVAFGWAVSDPSNPSASWWFELAAEPGGTRLRQGMRIGPAPSGLSIAIEAMPDKEEKIIARRLAEHERNMRATLEGIKRLAQAQE